MLAVSKEVVNKIPKHKCTKNQIVKADECGGMSSLEKWKRKTTPRKFSYFQGNLLERALQNSSLISENINLKYEDLRCFYCNQYNDDKHETAIQWIQCDSCEYWIHQQCIDKLKQTPISTLEDFLCKFCINTQENKMLCDVEKIKKCEKYFETYFKLTPSEIRELEIQTRKQRNSQK